MCPAALAYAVESSGSLTPRSKPAPVGAPAARDTSRDSSINSIVPSSSDVFANEIADELVPEMLEVEVLERVRRRGALLSVLCVAAPALALLTVALSSLSSEFSPLLVFALACVCGSLITDLVSFFAASSNIVILADGRDLAFQLSLAARSGFLSNADLNKRLLSGQQPANP